MKTFILTLALLSLAFQHPAEFPPGVYCAPPPSDHPCTCHRECKDGTDEEGNPVPNTTTVTEDPQCKQYCHKDHCSCPIHNCD